MIKNLTTIFGFLIIVSSGFLHIGSVLAEQPPVYFSTSFYGGDIAKSRDDEKFSEDWQFKDDSFIGGIENLKLRYPFKEGWLLKSEIKTLPGQRNHDLRFEISKKDLFYARINYKRFPHYYDNSGGVYKNHNTPFFINPEEPGTDRQNILLELGLTLPELPVFTLSYEKSLRDGEMASLTWGEAVQAGTDARIVPTLKDVNEDANIIKIGAKYKHDIANIEAEQRWEFTDMESTRTEKNYTDGVLSSSRRDTKDTYFESSQTTIKIDKRINKKLSLTGGYRYVKVDNDSEQIVRSFDGAGNPLVTGFGKNWFAPDSNSNVNTHLWNFNVLAKPVKNLTVQGFFRVKNSHRDSASSFFNDTAGTFDFSKDTTHIITARTNDLFIAEAVRVAYKGIKRITPYFEAEWQQGNTELKERDSGSDSVFFQRDTDRNYDKQIYTVGMGFYPFRKFSGSVQYRKVLKKNEYSDDLDTESRTNQLDTAGYSAFIDKQDFDTDIFTTRLTAHPIHSVTTTFRYEYRNQDIVSKMDGLSREEAYVDAHTLSGSVSITPFSNLFITSMVMHQNHRVKTGARYDASIPGVARAFESDSTTFVNSAIFALNKKTEFSADYEATLNSNYDENNIADKTVPYEHDYTRQALTLGVKHKIRKNMTMWSRYSLYDYSESHIADIDDYTEHLFAVGGEIRLR